MKVIIVKEVKRSDGLWRFACGDVYFWTLPLHFDFHFFDLFNFLQRSTSLSTGWRHFWCRSRLARGKPNSFLTCLVTALSSYLFATLCIRLVFCFVCLFTKMQKKNQVVWDISLLVYPFVLRCWFIYQAARPKDNQVPSWLVWWQHHLSKLKRNTP